MVTTIGLAYYLNVLCKIGVAALVYTVIFESVSSLAMFYRFKIILFVFWCILVQVKYKNPSRPLISTGVLYDCPSASVATPNKMCKHKMKSNYDHSQAMHNKLVYIYSGIYCRCGL